MLALPSWTACPRRLWRGAWSKLTWMGAPTYDSETLSGYFQPVHAATWEDPVVGPVLRRLAREAPEVIEAVAEVDRSLIVAALAQSLEVRLARALGMAAFVSRTRRAMGREDG